MRRPRPSIDGGARCTICHRHMATAEIFAKFLNGASWQFSCRDCEPRFNREIVLPITDENPYNPTTLNGKGRTFRLAATHPHHRDQI